MMSNSYRRSKNIREKHEEQQEKVYQQELAK